MTTPSIAALRRVLECITDNVTPVPDQPAVVAKMKPAFPHSISPAPTDLSPAIPVGAYNCFEFAFGVAGNRKVHLISRALHSTCCDGIFVAYLAESILIPVESAANGDLVLYHDGRNYVHAGRVLGDFVLSKWGNGLLWVHGTYEVPESYGNSALYYKATKPDMVLTKFVEYAIQREGSVVSEILKPGPTSSAAP